MSHFMNRLTSPDSLTQVEVVGLNAHLDAMTRSWADSFHASRPEDPLDSWSNQYFQEARRKVVDTKGFERFFIEREQRFDSIFRAFLKEEIRGNEKSVRTAPIIAQTLRLKRRWARRIL